MFKLLFLLSRLELVVRKSPLKLFHSLLKLPLYIQATIVDLSCCIFVDIKCRQIVVVENIIIKIIHLALEFIILLLILADMLLILIISGLYHDAEFTREELFYLMNEEVFTECKISMLFRMIQDISR